MSVACVCVFCVLLLSPRHFLLSLRHPVWMSEVLAFCKITSLILFCDPLMTEIPFHRSCGQLTTSQLRRFSTKNDLDMLSPLPYLKQFLLKVDSICSKYSREGCGTAFSSLKWYQDRKASSINNILLAFVGASCCFFLRFNTDARNLKSHSAALNGLSTHSLAQANSLSVELSCYVQTKAAESSCTKVVPFRSLINKKPTRQEQTRVRPLSQITVSEFQIICKVSRC